MCREAFASFLGIGSNTKLRNYRTHALETYSIHPPIHKFTAKGKNAAVATEVSVAVVSWLKEIALNEGEDGAVTIRTTKNC